MLKIDKEFQSMLRNLTNEEKDNLEANILSDGYAHSPIMTWRGHIVDGHNRYEICTHYGLPYETQDLDHLQRGQVREWIVNNQEGRRNLTKQEVSYIRGTLVNNAQSKAKVSTAKAVAKKHGVSERTVRSDASFAKDIDKLDDSVKDDILKGVIKPSKSDVKSLSSKPKAKQKKIARDLKEGNISTIKNPGSINDLAAPYKRAVKDLRRIQREVAELSNSPTLGQYIATKQTRVVSCLTEAEDAINQCTPVMGCDSCGGQGCNACYGTGFLSRAAAESKGH